MCIFLLQKGGAIVGWHWVRRRTEEHLFHVSAAQVSWQCLCDAENQKYPE
jgi:hypothetical protein